MKFLIVVLLLQIIVNCAGPIRHGQQPNKCEVLINGIRFGENFYGIGDSLDGIKVATDFVFNSVYNGYDFIEKGHRLFSIGDKSYYCQRSILRISVLSVYCKTETGIHPGMSLREFSQLERNTILHLSNGEDRTESILLNDGKKSKIRVDLILTSSKLHVPIGRNYKYEGYTAETNEIQDWDATIDRIDITYLGNALGCDQ